MVRIKNEINVVVMLITISCALLLQSCAPTRPTKLSAVISSDQKIGFEDTIVSQKKHFVTLSPYEDLDVAEDKTMFMLGIQSGGDTPFDIGYDSVSVYFQDSGMTQPISRIRVQSYEDFIDDLREEQRRKENKYIRNCLERFISRLEGGSPPSQEEMLEEFDDLELDIESMRANNQMLRDALPEIILQPRTVMPGGAYNGIVVCDTRNLDEKVEGRFQVAVLVDGEQHIFSFNRLLNK